MSEAGDGVRAVLTWEKSEDAFDLEVVSVAVGQGRRADVLLWFGDEETFDDATCRRFETRCQSDGVAVNYKTTWEIDGLDEDLRVEIIVDGREVHRKQMDMGMMRMAAADHTVDMPLFQTLDVEQGGDVDDDAGAAAAAAGGDGGDGASGENEALPATPTADAPTPARSTPEELPARDAGAGTLPDGTPPGAPARYPGGHESPQDRALATSAATTPSSQASDPRRGAAAALHGALTAAPVDAGACAHLLAAIRGPREWNEVRSEFRRTLPAVANGNLEDALCTALPDTELEACRHALAQNGVDAPALRRTTPAAAAAVATSPGKADGHSPLGGSFRSVGSFPKGDEDVSNLTHLATRRESRETADTPARAAGIARSPSPPGSPDLGSPAAIGGGAGFDYNSTFSSIPPSIPPHTPLDGAGHTAAEVTAAPAATETSPASDAAQIGVQDLQAAYTHEELPEGGAELPPPPPPPEDGDPPTPQGAPPTTAATTATASTAAAAPLGSRPSSARETPAGSLREADEVPPPPPPREDAGVAATVPHDGTAAPVEDIHHAQLSDRTPAPAPLTAVAEDTRSSPPPSRSASHSSRPSSLSPSESHTEISAATSAAGAAAPAPAPTPAAGRSEERRDDRTAEPGASKPTPAPEPVDETFIVEHMVVDRGCLLVSDVERAWTLRINGEARASGVGQNKRMWVDVPFTARVAGGGTTDSMPGVLVEMDLSSADAAAPHPHPGHSMAHTPLPVFTAEVPRAQLRGCGEEGLWVDLHLPDLPMRSPTRAAPAPGSPLAKAFAGTPPQQGHRRQPAARLLVTRGGPTAARVSGGTTEAMIPTTSNPDLPEPHTLLLRVDRCTGVRALKRVPSVMLQAAIPPGPQTQAHAQKAAGEHLCLLGPVHSTRNPIWNETVEVEGVAARTPLVFDVYEVAAPRPREAIAASPYSAQPHPSGSSPREHLSHASSTPPPEQRELIGRVTFDAVYSGKDGSTAVQLPIRPVTSDAKSVKGWCQAGGAIGTLWATYEHRPTSAVLRERGRATTPLPPKAALAVRLRVAAASGLVPLNVGDRQSSPQIRVLANGREVGRSGTCMGLAPQWDFELAFPMETEMTEVVVQVVNDPLLGKPGTDGFLGETRFHVDCDEFVALDNKTLPLLPRLRSAVDRDLLNRYGGLGEVTMSIAVEHAEGAAAACMPPASRPVVVQVNVSHIEGLQGIPPSEPIRVVIEAAGQRFVTNKAVYQPDGPTIFQQPDVNFVIEPQVARNLRGTVSVLVGQNRVCGAFVPLGAATDYRRVPLSCRHNGKTVPQGAALLRFDCPFSKRPPAARTPVRSVFLTLESASDLTSGDFTHTCRPYAVIVQAKNGSVYPAESMLPTGLDLPIAPGPVPEKIVQMRSKTAEGVSPVWNEILEIPDASDASSSTFLVALFDRGYFLGSATVTVSHTESRAITAELQPRPTAPEDDRRRRFNNGRLGTLALRAIVAESPPRGAMISPLEWTFPHATADGADLAKTLSVRYCLGGGSGYAPVYVTKYAARADESDFEGYAQGGIDNKPIDFTTHYGTDAMLYASLWAGGRLVGIGKVSIATSAQGQARLVIRGYDGSALRPGGGLPLVVQAGGGGGMDGGEVASVTIRWRWETEPPVCKRVPFELVSRALAVAGDDDPDAQTGAGAAGVYSHTMSEVPVLTLCKGGTSLSLARLDDTERNAEHASVRVRINRGGPGAVSGGGGMATTIEASCENCDLQAARVGDVIEVESDGVVEGLVFDDVGAIRWWNESGSSLRLHHASQLADNTQRCYAVVVDASGEVLACSRVSTAATFNETLHIPPPRAVRVQLFAYRNHAFLGETAPLPPGKGVENLALHARPDCEEDNSIVQRNRGLGFLRVSWAIAPPAADRGSHVSPPPSPSANAVAHYAAGDVDAGAPPGPVDSAAPPPPPPGLADPPAPDTATARYSVRCVMNTAQSQFFPPLQGAAVCRVGNRVYLVGGAVDSSTSQHQGYQRHVGVFETMSRQWRHATHLDRDRERKPLSEPPMRHGHTAVAYQGKIIVYGGWGPGGFDRRLTGFADKSMKVVVDKAEDDSALRHQGYHLTTHVFDPSNANDPWSDMETTGVVDYRACHSATVTGNKMVVWGGWKVLVQEMRGKTAGHAVSYRVLEHRRNDMAYLNLTTREWKKIKQRGVVPAPRCSHTVTKVGTLLVLFGGCTENAGGSAAPPANSSRSGEPSYMNAKPPEDAAAGGAGDDDDDDLLPPQSSRSRATDARSGSHSRRSRTATPPTEGAAFIPDPTITPLNDLMCFDLTTKSWTILPAHGAVPAPRYGHSAALDPDAESLLIVGGWGNTGAPLHSMYQYCFSSRYWRKVAFYDCRPCRSRMGSAAVLLPALLSKQEEQKLASHHRNLVPGSTRSTDEKRISDDKRKAIQAVKEKRKPRVKKANTNVKPAFQLLVVGGVLQCGMGDAVPAPLSARGPPGSSRKRGGAKEAASRYRIRHGEYEGTAVFNLSLTEVGGFNNAMMHELQEKPRPQPEQPQIKPEPKQQEEIDKIIHRLSNKTKRRLEKEAAAAMHAAPPEQRKMTNAEMAQAADRLYYAPLKEQIHKESKTHEKLYGPRSGPKFNEEQQHDNIERMFYQAREQRTEAAKTRERKVEDEMKGMSIHKEQMTIDDEINMSDRLYYKSTLNMEKRRAEREAEAAAAGVKSRVTRDNTAWGTTINRLYKPKMDFKNIWAKDSRSGRSASPHRR